MSNELAVVDHHGTPLPATLDDRAPLPGDDAHPGASLLPTRPEQRDILAAPAAAADLDVLPTGEVYLAQVHVRARLTKAFGPGAWTLLPRSEWAEKDNTLCREYALFVHGHFVASAVGEMDYQPGNSRMSWATATEGVKSDALKRCCKDLGIGAECWDRHFTARFHTEHCLLVETDTRSSGRRYDWRRSDAPALPGEKGPAPEGAVAGRVDDGGGSPRAPERRDAGGQRLASEAQVRMLMARAKSRGVGLDALKQHAGVDKLEALPFAQVNPILAWLDGQGGDEPGAAG